MNEFDTNIPIYLQIMNSIKQQIVSGQLKPGDKLASVREQAEAFSVNPNTVQRAYQELEREGVSETRRGTGSFIAEKANLIPDLAAQMAHEVIRKCIEGMRALGFTDAQIVTEVERALEHSRTAQHSGGTH